MVLDNLTDCNNGLITKNELRKAIKEVASQNNVDLDNKDLSKIVDAAYTNTDGTLSSSVSRLQVREAMENLP